LILFIAYLSILEVGGWEKMDKALRLLMFASVHCIQYPPKKHDTQKKWPFFDSLPKAGL